MARIRNSSAKTLSPIKQLEYNGLWIESTGDTQIPFGYSGNMTNFFITKLKKLQKMFGYKSMYATPGEKEVKTIWYGNVNGTNCIVYISNGKVFHANDDVVWDDASTWIDTDYWDDTRQTEIGTITEDTTSMFGFGGNLYIQNGNEYYKWTGTGNISIVSGYIPKVVGSAIPATGVGTILEEPNLLTGKKYQGYISNNTTLYKITESNLTSVDAVYVDGVLKTVTTDYTVNLTNGTVTFVVAPGNSTIENVLIYWTKGSGSRSEVTNNKYNEIYGQQNDTRVFFYGNSSAKNRIVYSGIANGIPSAEYFPENNFFDIGSLNTAVKDMKTNNTSFIVYKDDKPYIGTSEYDSNDNLFFSIFPLDDMPTLPYSQVRVCDSIPFSIGKNIMSLSSTYIRSERNSQKISDKIQIDLDAEDLTKAKTCDFESKKWYILSVGQWVWIYDYELGTFSRLYLYDEPTCWLEIEGKLFFGTSKGYVKMFDENLINYDGQICIAHWESNFEAFGLEYLYKDLRKLWIQLKPDAKSYLKITLETQNGKSNTNREVEYFTIDFGNIDFGDFTFNTITNVKAFLVKLKAKKFTHIKVHYDCDKIDRQATVLGMILPITVGGQVK